MDARTPGAEHRAPAEPERSALPGGPFGASLADARTFVLASLMVAAGWAVICWPWLTGQVTIPWDAKGQFHQFAAFLAQSLARGESPFWNPYVFLGHPQIADPQSLIFAPPFLLLALFAPDPSFRAVDTFTLLMLLFGAGGVLLYGRDRGWHAAAGVVAAFAFMFGAAAGWRIQHVGQILSLAYLPWALVMLDRAILRASIPCGALSGFFAAMMLLGPDQVAFLGAFALLVLALGRLSQLPGGWAEFRRAAPPLLAGAVVGAVVVTVPTLFVLAFADDSNRAMISLDDAYLGSMHPSSLLTFGISNLYGTIGPGEDYWGAPSRHWPYIVKSYLARNMANVYMGVLPAIGIVALLASPAGWSRRKAVIALSFLAMIAYALGRYTPVFHLFYTFIPGTDLFRRPADSLFLAGTMGAYLAGYGIDRLLRPGARLDPFQRVALAAMALMCLGGGISMAIWLGKLAQVWPVIALAGLSALAGFGLLRLAQAPRLAASPLLVTALIAGAMTADFRWNLRPNDSTGLLPREYGALKPNTRNETVAYLKAIVVQQGDRRDRVELTALGFEWPNLGMVHRLENTLGYNPLRLGYFSKATGAGDHAAGFDQHVFSKLFPSYRSPLANLMGLRFVVLGVPIDKVDRSMATDPLPMVFRSLHGYVYENKEALPRVFVARSAVVADPDAIIASGEWPSTDFRALSSVEATEAALPKDAPPATATLERYRNTRIDIRVEAPGGGLLVLNDVWHPWWQAEVDGNPVPVLRTNAIFRGVVLPPGAKRVTFVFRPISGLIGDLRERLTGRR